MSLTDQLAAANMANRAQIPAPALAVIDRATAALTAADPTAGAVSVGDSAPSFELPNAIGQTIRLGDLLAQGPVVLTFYRGGWCPYCSLELKALQDALPAITEAGARLVAISPQTPDATLSTAEKKALSFDVLSDVGNAVAREYGLVFEAPADLVETYQGFGIDLEAANGDATHELPMPATFVIDLDGTVRYAFVDPDYTQRAEPADVVAALQALGVVA
ncbi:peroxiredoxin-like family protein [Rubrivirga sp. IMCC45206]|uniref:peroxiredoxin-like family protein n=1 Tax=Rubrivirga sp. IMCC45206 TaxID=3391614 RepID=UPI0039901527